MTEPAPLTRRRANTRARLMTAAIEAFAERGVMAASVEDICERASFTRGAFYSNFTDKSELVFALLDQEISEVVDRAHQVVGESLADAAESDSAALVAKATDAFARAARPQSREWVIVQEELRLYALRNPSSYQQYDKLEREYLGSVRDLLTDALNRIGREFVLPVDDAINILAAVQKQHNLDALAPEQVSHARGSGPPLNELLMLLTRPVD